MYNQVEWRGSTHLDVDLVCPRARHMRAFGLWGMPVETPEVEMDAGPPPGHLKPFGFQGQPRRSTPVHEGCAHHELTEAIRHNTPLLMRSCVALASPRVLGWTNEHLTSVAGNQSSRFCPDELGELRNY